VDPTAVPVDMKNWKFLTLLGLELRYTDCAPDVSKEHIASVSRLEKPTKQEAGVYVLHYYAHSLFYKNVNK
jgi:hypothetical protein